MVFATSPSSFSSLRPLVLRLARLGASYPIELIVTVFCAVTLVYFQLLKVRSHTPARCYGAAEEDERRDWDGAGTRPGWRFGGGRGGARFGPIGLQGGVRIDSKGVASCARLPLE